MAGLAIPVIEGAVEALGPILARAGAALLGGAAVGATGSLSGDTKKEDSKAAPAVRTLPRTDESCKKCPAEEGLKVRVNHGVNWTSYRYQARITGFPFDSEECRWSDEWKWQGIDFDGFMPAACMLQETKGDYDQFIDPFTGEVKPFFSGFIGMQEQIVTQANAVNSHPPARLTWYFMTPLARQLMLRVLTRQRVLSVYEP
ncbi:restriction endonuclease fold toxin 5 domain-containing protein [Burkholderia sp. WSM2232]|uniref:restriction endonuclease fold toxin 5 domain-containing protein n=1 Tax=Burkholderia sp. WSM2232 TaxID=944436 RepID=UPI000A0606B9|nr:restriction endonuclease fold toxin 5 domain-containing protein [Burkholderia sp. WSM2232]